MQDDLKSIFDLYESTTVINHTTTSNAPYMYAPKEYPSSREENQENKTEKGLIVKKLEQCLADSKTGQKEKYAKILLNLQDIQNKIKVILTN